MLCLWLSDFACFVTCSPIGFAFYVIHVQTTLRKVVSRKDRMDRLSLYLTNERSRKTCVECVKGFLYPVYMNWYCFIYMETENLNANAYELQNYVKMRLPQTNLFLCFIGCMHLKSVIQQWTRLFSNKVLLLCKNKVK